jgi:hypothetical protein
VLSYGLGDFTNDLVRTFIFAQSNENRLPKLAVACPFGEFDLANQFGPDPMCGFHLFGGKTRAITSAFFFRQIDEGTILLGDGGEAFVKFCQKKLVEARSHFAGEIKLLIAIISDQ